MNDGRRPQLSLEDAPLGQDIDAANAFDDVDAGRFHRRPRQAAVARAVERSGIGDVRIIISADIAEKAVVLVDEAQRPNKRARLIPNLAPGVAAIGTAIELAGAVSIPAEAARYEKDVVLLAAESV